MFLQPILFFTALLWTTGLTLIGLVMMFRRASHPVSVHDRVIGFLSMTTIGLVGGAVLVGIAIIFGELF